MGEYDEQAAIINWARLLSGNEPRLEYLHAIPNGARVSRSQAKKLKAEGLKAGAPDLCLPAPAKGYHGLYIELKWGSNTPTEEQQKFLDFLHEQGYLVLVCWSAPEAIGHIVDYLDMDQNLFSGWLDY